MYELDNDRTPHHNAIIRMSKLNWIEAKEKIQNVPYIQHTYMIWNQMSMYNDMVICVTSAAD